MRPRLLSLIVFALGGCFPTPNPSIENVRNVCLDLQETSLVDCTSSTAFDADKCQTALLAACTSSDTAELDDANRTFCTFQALDPSNRPPCGDLPTTVKECFVDAGLTSACNATLQEQIVLLGPNPDGG